MPTPPKLGLTCQATLLVVSHDRGFLDDVVTDVVQLRSRCLTYFKGDVSGYVKLVEEQKREQRRRCDLARSRAISADAEARWRPPAISP